MSDNIAAHAFAANPAAPISCRTCGQERRFHETEACTAVRIAKAQRIGDTQTPDLMITAVEELRCDDSPDGASRHMLTFTEDAIAVVSAMYATLPGGTLDQILRLMLERKASQLIVRF